MIDYHTISPQTWIKRQGKPILIQGYAPVPQKEFIKAWYLMENNHTIGFDMETGRCIDLCCERELT